MSVMIILAAQLALKVLPMVNVVPETVGILPGGTNNEIVWVTYRPAENCNNESMN